MMNTGIYTITSPSGGQYVGSAINLAARWKGHSNALRAKRHNNRILQAAWNKYDGQFVFAKLLVCSRDDLLFFEQRAINILKPRYNIAQVAGNTLGVKYTVESRAKIGNALRGKKHPPKSAETRLNLSKALMGHAISAETKAKIAASLLGRVLSNEHRKKISVGGKGKTRSLETRARMSAARKLRAPMSDKTCAKISASKKGVLFGPRPQQWKDNIRAGLIATYKARAGV